jgi:hypothetical protein
LISSWIRKLSTNLMRALMDGVDGFSGSFSDFFRMNALTWEHCSTFDLKMNFSFCPLMLSWISPAPTSMCAFAVSRTAFPIWEGSWCRLPCWEWQNQWGQRNSVFSPEYSRQFPWDNEPIGPLAANK